MRGAIGFAFFLLVACRAAAPAYPAVGECPALADKPADWCDGPITTVGLFFQNVIVTSSMPTDPSVQAVYFQDLERVDPDYHSPWQYSGICYRCFLAEGQAYRARLTKDGLLYSILVDGRELRARSPGNEEGAVFSGVQWDSAGNPTVTPRDRCTEKPGHWERRQLDDGTAIPWCVAGKDSRAWSLAGPSERSTLPPCDEHGPYTNRTFKVVIDVTPGGGMAWTFDEAPAEVAHDFLYDLNQNGSGLVFEEANGVDPDLRFSVTLTQTIEGTERDTASVWAHGLGEGDLFTLTSGDAAFTSWHDAIAALAGNVGGFFSDGWHNKRPCVKRDQSILR